MAGRSCLLPLTLIVMFIFASAHRPLVESHSEVKAKIDGNQNMKIEGSPKPSSDWRMGAYEKEKIDGSPKRPSNWRMGAYEKEKIDGSPKPPSDWRMGAYEKEKIDGSPKPPSDWRMGAYENEKRDEGIPKPPSDWRMGAYESDKHDEEIPKPPSDWRVGAYENEKHDEDWSMGAYEDEKYEASLKPPSDWRMGAYENEEQTSGDDDDATGPMAVPVYPVSSPGAANGGFHFDVGPIGFGGNVQIGLLPGAGFVVPFIRPYVVVPQYSGPGSPEPYPYGSGSPYQHPGSENGQPQQGYYGSFYPEHD